MNTSVRILLADDHELFRSAIRCLIERQLPSALVVGEAGDGREAVRLTTELKPDFVLMDLRMPELNGVDATRQILHTQRATKVIILSMHCEPELIHETLKCGAAGYVLKYSASSELITAFKVASEGKVYLSPTIAGMVVATHIRHDPANGSTCPGAFSVLSCREREVLQLLAEGLTSKEIASHLEITQKTVESHRSQIMRRLEIRSIANLTKYAIRQGLTMVG